jgi:type II secretory pathway pseudopilin PulG
MTASRIARLLTTERPSRRSGEEGQVLAFLCVALVAIMAMAALLFAGGQALLQRRELQNASDAAALAAANLIQARTGTKTGSGCSPTATPTPGAPWSELVTAARNSVATNLPSYDTSNVVVTCPAGHDNYAVSVALTTRGDPLFGGLSGSGLQVSATSTAINGQLNSADYSVVTLDPSHSSWPNNYRGCPSVLFSGGPTVIFDGSLMIDSACMAANGGGLATNGGAGTVTLNNSSTVRIAGGYNQANLTITPAPLTGQTPIADPLSGLDPISTAGMTVQSTSRLVLNNDVQVLQPGIYRGGIQLKNSSIAYLRPGIFVMDGGGLDLGAQSSVYAIPASLTSTTTASWSTDCAPSAHTCGVMILNSGGSSMDQITVGAGATLKLRAYDAQADANPPASADQYNGLLIWQESAPAASSSYAQPTLLLSGGGNVNISGTVYAPQALVHMGGSSGGSGGGDVNLTLQFICYDLEIQGNVAFHFNYVDNEFAKPTDYGLIQ